MEQARESIRCRDGEIREVTDWSISVEDNQITSTDMKVIELRSLLNEVLATSATDDDYECLLSENLTARIREALAEISDPRSESVLP